MSFSCTICHDLLSQTLVDLQLDDSAIVDNDSSGETSPTANEVISAECGHVFHTDCLEKWFESQEGKVVCPVCRVSIHKRNSRRLYLSSLASDFVSKYIDMKSEIRDSRRTISQLESSLKNLQEKLEDAEDNLQTARLDLERQNKEIHNLNTEIDGYIVRDTMESNWAEIAENLKSENTRLKLLLDESLQENSPDSPTPKPIPIAHHNWPSKFDSDENGNMVSNPKDLVAEHNAVLNGIAVEKTRTPVPAASSRSCNELCKTMLDFKNCIALSGVERVVADLKLLVELESSETESTAPMVEDALLSAISKQTACLQVCEFLKECAVTIVRERLMLQKLKSVHQQVFPGGE